MDRKFDRKIVLEDGAEYYGYGFGDMSERVCEVVFNTSMVGYQEVMSDPANTDQLVVMTYPLIGNYGIADEDFESKVPSLGALAVREYNDLPSNFRCTQTLSETLEEYGIPGICGLDTRKLTRSIRDKGSRRGVICAANKPLEEALDMIKNTPVSKDVVARVSTKKKWYSRTVKHRFNVVVVDCGTKLSLVKNLNAKGCNVTVVPWNTPAEDIRAMKPDGILVSGGPGNPEDVRPVIELVKELRGRYPIFGIGLGHQIIGLACGATAYKLKFGHRGGNHPVKELATGKIAVTNQNHSYAISDASVEGTGLSVTHVDLMDNTVEGFECAEDRMFSVQFEPECITDSEESADMFDKFLGYMSR